MKKLVLLMLYLIQGVATTAQTKVFIGETEEIIYPMSGAIDPGARNADSFKAIFRDKTIIALGEATHGTLEFGQHKLKLVQFLVEHCGYKSIMFEASTGAFNFINDYVRYGLGNIDTMLRQQNYWIFYTEEVRSLIEWLRTFNISKAQTDQVSVYGIDMQLPQPELWYLSQRIDRLSFPAKKSFEDILNPVKEYARPENLLKSATDKLAPTKIQEAIPVLDKWFADNKAVLAGLLDTETLQLMDLNIENAKNGARIADHNLHFRDSCMAVNVRRLQSINGGKTIIWAHNGHISMADPQVGYEKFRKPMGEWLHQEYGDKYYAIGFFFGRGSFLAAERKNSGKGVVFPHLRVSGFASKLPGDLSHLFSNVNANSFFINISNSANPMWKKPYPTYIVGAVYEKGKSYTYYVTPGIAFDALIYVDQAHPAAQIDEYFYRTVK